jgi:hypothetical protein
MRIEGESARRSQSPLSSSTLSNGGKVKNGYTNGKVDTNGSASSPSSHKHTNGSTSLKPPASSVWYGHNREELTRILIQCLDEMGYSNAAQELSKESNYELEGPAVAAFRSAVVQGDWPEAEALLFGHGVMHVGFGGDGGRENDSAVAGNGDSKNTFRGLPLVEAADVREMLFALREQKYLELLESRDISAALLVLRQELTPLNEGSDRVHFLGGYDSTPS